MQIEKAKRLAEIQISVFSSQVSSLGSETITSIARAGPELQAKLLSGLGLQSVLLTDGTTPVNLYQTAQGLLGNVGKQ